jgi:hypothetical protein
LKKKDIVGQKFGRWTVLKEMAQTKKHGSRRFLCECECGGRKVVNWQPIVNGGSRSCGCLAKELKAARRITHGKSKTRLYGIWSAMKARCSVKNHQSYGNYGGRGISVCDEWFHDFLPFHDWAIFNGYNDKLTIERINNNGDYCPENCRWATRREQLRNKRTSRNITYRGETLLLEDWARKLGIKANTLIYRLKNFDMDKAMMPGRLPR